MSLLQVRWLDGESTPAGQVPTSQGDGSVVWAAQTGDGLKSVQFVIGDWNGSTLLTGVYGPIYFSKAVTIQSWELVANVSGSLGIDLWKDTYANWEPDVADSITGSAKPTLTGAKKNNSSTLTGWTTAVAVGDYIMLNVDSVTTVAWASLILKFT